MEAITSIGIFFTKGGAWMYFILATQIVATAITIERIVALYVKRKPNQKALALSFERDIKKGDLEGVIEKTSQAQGNNPVARVILAGTQAAADFGGQDEVQGKMDEILIEENGEFEKRLGFMPMLANVGTLAGLLGTIVGMISAFSAVSVANPAEKATLLSAGISEAMNTTAYGLIVAIPTLVAYAILQNRANQLVEDLNQGALKVFNWLSYAYQPVPARPALNGKSKSQTAPEATV